MATMPPSDANTRTFLESAGTAKTIARYAKGDTIFAQGDACKHVLYIQTGGIRLSVLSKTGRNAVVAKLGPGAFFGEIIGGPAAPHRECDGDRSEYILLVRKEKMLALLHSTRQPTCISHLLARNIRSEEDLVDQLFNSSEKRLASTLLLA